MTSDLTGRTALVTGATSGIGAAIAHRLAAAGAHVVVTGRDDARGASVVAAIRADGGTADFAAVDLGAAPAVLRDFTAALPPVDILVNNAGVYPVGATAEMADDDLDQMFAVNLRAPHVLVAELAPKMAAGGVIVNIGSWMGILGSAGSAMYSATKAATHELTRAWAAEFGPRGVRVNTVAPGVTLTPGNEAFGPVLDAMTARTPAGTVVQPGDIAAAVLFLAGDDARMIHGTTLTVDGGISTTLA